MKADWLWDRKISVSKAKGILKCENNSKFIEMAALLLSRKNIPKEVFGEFLDKEIFVKNWARIKRHMRRDQWNDPRVEFWQAIYEKLFEIYKKKGFVFRVEKSKDAVDLMCKQVGEGICRIRKNQKLTQRELEHQWGISLQIMSKIEKGRHNGSLLTMKKIELV